MADQPVFISYARKTSRDYAEALHRELGAAGVRAFLDSSDIESLDQFPTEIAEALLAAKVVFFGEAALLRRISSLRGDVLAKGVWLRTVRRGTDSILDRENRA